MYCSDFKIENRPYFTLIVAAAGSGKRMGLEQKKQFLKFRGVSLYLSAVLQGEKSDLIDEIIIVTSEADVETIKHECNELQIKKVKKVVCGGAERQDSIYNALMQCEEGIIAVQDGARPFLEEKYFEEGLNTLLKDKDLSGVVVGVKVKDTIKKVYKNTMEIESTPVRETLFLAQTPQIFKSEILKEAYELAKRNSYYGTDDASLVEELGKKVSIIQGSYDNIKITTIEDLKYLK
ncbi:MAG: 2-C-methyl-D-erythritol 4-phosphate cytidylyltransferase [Fusobacteriaceae bacterium]